MSPTAPTFGTLNAQLNKAHHRIRQLEARETELLARNMVLCAVISELTHDDHARTAAGLTLSPTMAVAGSASAITWASTQASAPVLGRDHRHPRRTQRRQAHPDRAPTASKRGDQPMFDLDPIGATFLIIAVLSLIAAVAFGRDDR